MLKGQAPRTARFGLKPAIAVTFLATALHLGSCSPQDNSQQGKSVTLAMEATAVNSLIYIA
jgi:hypothetical protein